MKQREGTTAGCPSPTPATVKVRFFVEGDEEALVIGSLLAQLMETEAAMEADLVDDKNVLVLTVPARWTPLIPFLFGPRRVD
jgi:hypothetical protein